MAKVRKAFEVGPKAEALDALAALAPSAESPLSASPPVKAIVPVPAVLCTAKCISLAEAFAAQQFGGAPASLGGGAGTSSSRGHGGLGSDSSHDWSHIQRVRRMALKLATEEGLGDEDKRTCDLVALLHDVPDEKFPGWEARKQQLESFLVGLVKGKHLGSSSKDVAWDAISRMSFKDERKGSCEGEVSNVMRVVQDADRLDALGAVGVARCFAFGGQRGSPLIGGGINDSSSCVGHFRDKLLKLTDMMKTNAGRRHALERHLFMQLFLQSLEREVGVPCSSNHPTLETQPLHPPLQPPAAPSPNRASIAQMMSLPAAFGHAADDALKEKADAKPVVAAGPPGKKRKRISRSNPKLPADRNEGEGHFMIIADKRGKCKFCSFINIKQRKQAKAVKSDLRQVRGRKKEGDPDVKEETKEKVCIVSRKCLKCDVYLCKNHFHDYHNPSHDECHDEGCTKEGPGHDHH